MKRLTLILGMLLMLANSDAQSLALGPVGGFGHSWMSGLDNQSFKPSAYLGIGFMYSHSFHWAYGLDVTASHEGYRLDYTRNGMDQQTTVDPIYLRLTPNVYYYFARCDKIRPRLVGGLSMGYIMREGHYYTDDYVRYTDEPRIITADKQIFRNMDLGFDAGIGATAELCTNTWFNMDLLYYNGLIDVTRMEQRNRNIRLNLGLMFRL